MGVFGLEGAGEPYSIADLSLPVPRGHLGITHDEWTTMISSSLDHHLTLPLIVCKLQEMGRGAEASKKRMGWVFK